MTPCLRFGTFWSPLQLTRNLKRREWVNTEKNIDNIKDAVSCDLQSFGNFQGNQGSYFPSKSGVRFWVFSGLLRRLHDFLRDENMSERLRLDKQNEPPAVPRDRSVLRNPLKRKNKGKRIRLVYFWGFFPIVWKTNFPREDRRWGCWPASPSLFTIKIVLF